MNPLRLYLLVALILGNSLVAEDRTGSVSGFIYDAANREALIGVNVYLNDLMIGSTTNVSGYYIITRIPAGRHTLVSEYLGYRTRLQTIEIAPGENRKLDLVMVLEAIESAAVIVVADSMRVSERLYEKPLSSIQLTARQINNIPQVAESDLLRSLQTLPGILPISDFSSALYVRGGTPDQNLYLLDGTDVYNPEHAFGIFSTFNTDAIKHVEVSKGGFSAAYGGRLSSVLDVINLDGNREEFEGKLSISLLSAKTTLQMPIGQNGAISGSLRRTYFDKTLRNAIDDLPDYYFYDGNLKAFFDIDAKNKLTVSAYGGRDVLNIIFNDEASDQAGLSYDWGNRTGSVRWTRVFNPQLFANFWITGSRFESNFDLGEAIPVIEKNEVEDLTFKGNLEYHYATQLQLKFGFEQKNLRLHYLQEFPGGVAEIKQQPRHYVLYGQTNWRPTPRWDIELGLRYNYFDAPRNFQNLGPRFSAKYRLTETINLRAAAGIFHQYLHSIQQSFVSDIWSTSNEFQDASRAVHLIFGVQKEVARDYQVELEAYFKDYDNIYQFNYNFVTDLEPSRYNEDGNPVFTETRSVFHAGSGTSRGAELLVRKDQGTVTGWMGLSLAETRHNFPDINGGRDFAPRHDRAVTLNLVANLDIRNVLRSLRGDLTHSDRNKWMMGVNFVYGSSQPITAPGSGYILGSAPTAVQRYVEYYPAAINGFRLPYYARLDISFTYRKRFRNWSMAPYLQVFNVGNRKNAWFIDYNYQNGISDIEANNMFPLLPTIGVDFQF